MTYKVYFDGACHNEKANPQGNPMGYGVVMMHDTTPVAHYTHTSHKLGTSNIAEWEALLLATQKALDHANTNHYAEYMFLGDSQLIVNQVNGKWEVKEQNFHPYFTACRANIDLLKRRNQFLAVTWIQRENNQLADQLSKDGLWLYEHIFGQSVSQLHREDLPHKFNREQLLKWAAACNEEENPLSEFASLYVLYRELETGRVARYSEDDRKRFQKVLSRDYVQFGVK